MLNNDVDEDDNWLTGMMRVQGQAYMHALFELNAFLNIYSHNKWTFTNRQCPKHICAKFSYHIKSIKRNPYDANEPL